MFVKLAIERLGEVARQQFGVAALPHHVGGPLDSVANPAELTLIARLTAKPEYADLLGAELQALVAPTVAEPGSIAYRVHRSDDDPAAWILYETWESRADLDAHFEQPYTKALMAQFPDLLAREMELNFATLTAPVA